PRRELRQPGRAARRPAAHHPAPDRAGRARVGRRRARLARRRGDRLRRGHRRDAGESRPPRRHHGARATGDPVARGGGGESLLAPHRHPRAARRRLAAAARVPARAPPGITDLRRNVLKRGTTVVFSTGPAIPATALTGTAVLWVEQRALAGAVIRAVPLPDTLAYVTVADSAGGFRLGAIPPGRYHVWAIQDQNANRLLDRREAFDTVTVTVDTSATAVLWAFVHDTVGPRVKSVDLVDT